MIIPGRKACFKTLLATAVIAASLASCTTLKEYDKVYLNDANMEPGNRAIEEFDSNFQSYKEGAVGGNNGNSGAGCGCN